MKQRLTRNYDCQVAVVGSGAGGSVTTACLAQADIDTLLLEEGKPYSPSNYGTVLDGFRQMYRDAGSTVLFGHPPISLPLGRTLGGTTTINSSTCFRPPEFKVERWKGPTFQEMVPFFDAVETRIHAHVVSEDLLGQHWTVMKRGCDRLGIPIQPLSHNLRDCRMSGRCQFGCPTGAKQSVDRTYIPDALSHGARIQTQHLVQGMKVKRDKVQFLHGISSEGPFTVHADAFVLSMGAMLSPAFLLRAGLGRRLPRIGKGLQIHPASRVVALFEETLDGHVALPQGAYIDHWKDLGVFMEGIFLHPSFLFTMLPGCGHRLKDLMVQYRNLSSFGIFVEDSNTGRVFKGHWGYPFWAYYNLSHRNAHQLRFGIARLAEIFLAAGALRVFTGFSPCHEIDSLQDLNRLEGMPVRPIDLELGAFHSVGTCAMGSCIDDSVVNQDLKVHGIDNLYIMDASVIPESLGVNPQITIMALCLKAAQSLSRRL